MEGNNNKKFTINISTRTLLEIAVIIGIVYFLVFIKTILAIIFVSIMLSAALTPSVKFLQRWKLPRPVSILFVYIALLSVISLAIAMLIPPIAEQIGSIAINFPEYWNNISSSFSGFQQVTSEYGVVENFQNGLESLQAGFVSTAQGVFSTLMALFGGIIAFFVILVITYYMLEEENAVKRLLRMVAPTKYIPYTVRIVNKIQDKIGLWVRAQLILGLIIALLSYIGLISLGVEYALVLALIAGLTEFVPYIGPLLGAIPAVFLAFTQSPTHGVLVIILYFIIQRIENIFIVPKVMQKTIGLNPVVSIIAIMIGARVGGAVGALLAIPVTTALSVIFNEVFSGEKDLENNENVAPVLPEGAKQVTLEE